MLLFFLYWMRYSVSAIHNQPVVSRSPECIYYNIIPFPKALEFLPLKLKTGKGDSSVIYKKCLPLIRPRDPDF